MQLSCLQQGSAGPESSPCLLPHPAAAPQPAPAHPWVWARRLPWHPLSFSWCYLHPSTHLLSGHPARAALLLPDIWGTIQCLERGHPLSSVGRSREGCRSAPGWAFPLGDMFLPWVCARGKGEHATCRQPVSHPRCSLSLSSRDVPVAESMKLLNYSSFILFQINGSWRCHIQKAGFSILVGRVLRGSRAH